MATTTSSTPGEIRSRRRGGTTIPPSFPPSLLEEASEGDYGLPSEKLQESVGVGAAAAEGGEEGREEGGGPSSRRNLCGQDFGQARALEGREGGRKEGREGGREG